jgi:Cellulase (glycosyl hydrolase family 5)
MKKGASIFACLLLCSFALCSSAAFAQALPDQFFGISVSQISTSFPLSGGIVLGTLGKLDGTSWLYIEPTSDCGPDPSSSCYKWGTASPPSGMVGWVTVAQANGYQLIYDFARMPGWVCPEHNTDGDCNALPSDLTAVSNFATALATKFKGQISYYETYNEVDNSSNWSDTCSNLVLFHNLIYTAIKAADPHALVGAPNMGAQSMAASACATNPTPSGNPSDPSIWLANFLVTMDSNGNLPKVDTVGVHTYGSFSYPGCSNTTTPACYIPAAYGCDWRVYKLHCAAQPLLNLYNAFREVMNNNGLASKPLLVTEGGFGNDASPSGQCPPSSPYLNTACLNPAQQTAYVGRWLALSASTWADQSGQLPSWYEYDGSWGTLNGTNGMDPQNASAYGQMESWLAGAVFQQPCRSGMPSTVFVCNFVNGESQNAEIVFNDQSGATAVYAPPTWASSYQPLLGTAQPIINASITVGDNPILLSAQIADFSMSVSPSSLSITAGQSASYTVGLYGLGAFNGQVSLTCGVVPAATCSISPPSVSVRPSSTSTAVLVVTSSSLSSKRIPARTRWKIVAVPSLLAFCFLLFACMWCRHSGMAWAVSLLLVLLVSAAFAGCGSRPQQATTYTVTVTGIAGSIQHSITATLVVQSN